jgi:predicted O-methyltransferase YrrM
MTFIPANHLYSKYCVGRRYSHLIYDLMMSGLFKNVLEIGCLQGYSTWAFLSALRDGSNFEFTACDVFLQETVLEMVKEFPVRLRGEMSVDVISPDFDFVFVDGNHDLNTVGAEISKILDCGTDTILAHDTFLEHDDFRGSVLLKKVFSNHRQYLSIHYNTHHLEDQTHYGMSLFTKRREVFLLAGDLFKRQSFDH